MTDLSTRTPVEIDTELARLFEIESRAEYRVACAKNTLERVSKTTQQLQEKYPEHYGPDFRFAGHAEAEADIARYSAEADGAREAARPLQLEYARRPWSRFFLVLNDNGHVHESRSCATCFPTTKYGWVTSLSGSTEEAAVKEYGDKMCTICFPSAPVSKWWGEGRVAREDREVREARKAERSAKRAVKAAKAVFHPTKGFVLYATERSAYQELARQLEWSDAAEIQKIAGALAAKHSSSVDDEIAIARDKTRWPKIERKAA